MDPAFLDQLQVLLLMGQEKEKFRLNGALKVLMLMANVSYMISAKAKVLIAMKTIYCAMLPLKELCQKL